MFGKLTFILLFFLAGISMCKAQGTWNIIPNAPAYTRFDDINFANDSTGFVSQSSILHKTTDKGNTWNQIMILDTVSQYVRSIEFINSNVGFAGILYSNGPLTGNLYKTTNGGYAWTLLQNMQIQPTDGICGMAHFDNRLVAVGTYSGPPWFYRTDDFGVSWMKVDLSTLADGLVDCHMISLDTIIVAGRADFNNQYAATILKSVDGGVSWTRVYLSNNPYSYCWKLFFRPSGLGVASVESNGVIETIARTVDNGNSWTTVELDSVFQNADLGGIAMLNDTMGWVCDQSGFGTWETRDGGITWNQIISPVYKGDRLVVVDSVTVLAAGQTIYKYDLSTVGISNPIDAKDENSHSLIVYPNPGKEIITIDAIALNNTFGLIDIIDEKGKMVQHLTRQPFIKGKNSFRVNIRNMAAGNYKVIWSNNEKLVSKTFSIIH